MNLKKKLNEMQKRPPHFISGMNRFKKGSKLKQKAPPVYGVGLKNHQSSKNQILHFFKIWFLRTTHRSAAV